MEWSYLFPLSLIFVSLRQSLASETSGTIRGDKLSRSTICPIAICHSAATHPSVASAMPPATEVARR